MRPSSPGSTGQPAPRASATPFPKPAISRMSVHPNRLSPIRQIHAAN
ncbi:hypothetical protein I552_9096 [Mycobacterium xenopi 3993]|nr:hypothetical protein I552_9096 [Mycobacterium xenopi 3993]